MPKSLFGLIRYKWYRIMEGELRGVRGELEVVEADLEKVRLELERERKGNEAESQKLRGVAEESIEIAEQYLKEMEDTKNKYSEFERLLSAAIKDDAHFSPHEMIVLRSYVPPVCTRPYKEKLWYGASHSHMPKGFKAFMEKIAKCPYVSRVSFVKNIGSAKKSYIEHINGNSMDIIYANDNFGTKLTVNTMANNGKQSEFVADLLRRELKLH